MEDPRYADFDGRDEHRDELVAVLRARFSELPASTWVARLEQAGVPVAHVNSVGEALDDKQARARGAVVGYEHPRLGLVRQVASPLHITGHVAAPAPAPARGAHGDELLRGLCQYNEAQLRAAHGAGAFEA